MKNQAVLNAQRAGYQFHGATAKPWKSEDVEKLRARLKEILAEVKPFGGHAKILQVIESTSYSYGTEKYRYYAIYVKYTPEYWADYEAKKARRELDRRIEQLKKMAEDLQDWELDLMVNHKKNFTK